MSKSLPKFSNLPLNPEDPPFSAWGLYGRSDEKGTINRLTNEVVLEAKKEIITGERISLNLPLDALGDHTFISRKPFHLEQWQKTPRIVNDDEWTFNSQSSTQWDGLRHFAYQEEAKFYNGVTIGDMFHQDGSKKSNVNGIQNWEESGIVGRGVLVDYDSWRRSRNLPYTPLPSEDSPPSGIPVEELQEVLKSQGTEIKFGDILIVRTGFTAMYDALSTAEKVAASKLLKGSGVEQSKKALQWLWENFAAIASDNVSVEKWPSSEPWFMHEILLAGWGMPIGELFNLEKLAAHCRKTNRWSFFLTSEVCNVPGAVASPPNVLAIF